MWHYACTHKWLIACVCPDVDVQVCFLREAFAAAWEVAVVLALLARALYLAFVGMVAARWGG